jgi:predicted aspartyl protease
VLCFRQEAGWYSGDANGRLGQLSSELFRARRLVVDTGLHAQRWTRQPAIDYGIPAAEMERYVVMPGQACAYKIGELEILAQRAKAQKALGSGFSMKKFHNLLLRTGTVPLAVLKQVVDTDIAATLKTPRQVTMKRMTRVEPHTSQRILWCGATALLTVALGLTPKWAAGTAPTVSPPTAPPAVPVSDAVEQLTEIMVEAREPRYVAPTRRDQIGRIWAPVFINGHGPFRLVLDTGASSSAVTAMVALALGIPTDQSPLIMLRGVTGSATVPSIRVNTLSVGDLAVDSPVLPIVPDALGGAEGILGSEGLANKRIFIDFRNDKIVITYSRDERTAHGFFGVPFRMIRGQLIVVDAKVGDVNTKAIIDTGGQTTIGNIALRDALAQHNLGFHGKPDQIVGATLAVQNGELISAPAIQLGSIQIRDSGVTFADMYIFKQWKLTGEPAIMIGMDALGTLDTLIIDYRRHELQMRMSKIS